MIRVAGRPIYPLRVVATGPLKVFLRSPPRRFECFVVSLPRCRGRGWREVLVVSRPPSGDARVVVAVAVAAAADASASQVVGRVSGCRLLITVSSASGSESDARFFPSAANPTGNWHVSFIPLKHLHL